MTFQFEGKVYTIEFARRNRENARATYPYTTATIYQIVSPQVQEPVRTWTVGCYFKDKFSYEDGRRAALRGALYDDPRGSGSKLPKAFKTAAWDAYFRRWKNGEWRLR